MSTQHRLVLAVITALLASAGFPILARANPPLAVTDAAPLVSTEVIAMTERSQPIRTSGLLSAHSEQKLAFKISGPLARITVREGDNVKAGQLLASLDLSEIDAQVSQARSRLNDAQRQAERLKTLQARQLVATQQLDAAETALNLARQDLKMAEFNRRHGEIRASGNGQVLQRLAEPNEIINPHQPVLVLAMADEGWIIHAGLSDREIVRIQAEDSAEVEFDAYPGQLFRGRVSNIAPQANPQTGTFDVDIRLEPAGQRLFSGFAGRIEILPAQRQAVAMVPVDALVWAARSQARLYRIDADQRLVTAQVQLGALDGDRVEVQAGLESGWRIVTEGTQRLREGMSVRLNPSAL